MRITLCLIVILVVSSCSKKHPYEHVQPNLYNTIKNDSLEVFDFVYFGEENYGMAKEIIDLEFIKEVDLKTKNIGIKNLELFLLNNKNFVEPKGDCATFWLQRGVLIKNKENRIIQLILLSCSGSELLWVENGKFIKKGLTSVGEHQYFTLINN